MSAIRSPELIKKYCAELRDNPVIKLPGPLQLVLQMPALVGIGKKYIVGKMAENALIAHCFGETSSAATDLDFAGDCPHDTLISLGFVQIKHENEQVGELYQIKLNKIKVDFYKLPPGGLSEDYQSRCTTDSALFIEEVANSNGQLGTLHDPSQSSIEDILNKKVRLINPSLSPTHIQVLRIIKKLHQGKKLDQDFLTSWQPPEIDHRYHYLIKVSDLLKSTNDGNLLRDILVQFNLCDRLFGKKVATELVQENIDTIRIIKTATKAAQKHFITLHTQHFNFFQSNGCLLLKDLKNIISLRLEEMCPANELNIEMMTKLFEEKFQPLLNLDKAISAVARIFKQDNDLSSALLAVNSIINTLSQSEKITASSRKYYAQLIKSLYQLDTALNTSLSMLSAAKFKVGKEYYPGSSLYAKK